MKQICTLIALVCALTVSTKSFSHNVSQNFESQAEVNSLAASCWTFNNVSFTNTSAITGSGSVVTQLGVTSEMITPELQIPTSLTISFSYNTIAGVNGSKTLKIFLLINGVETILESINLQNSSSGNFSGTFTSANTPGQNINGNRRVIFRVNNNASVVIDNLTINAPYTYLNGCAIANSPLPVSFAGFYGKKMNGGVLLTWNVGTEDNVSGYEVQRSIDGSSFSEIGFVAASNASSYNFIDSKNNGISYYRIKSIDIDGKYLYSTVISIKDEQSSVVFKAFPQPVQSALTVQHSSVTTNTKIEVLSTDGRIIKSIVPAKGSQQTMLDFTSAKAGVYFVRLVGKDTVESIKIIKQ